MKKLFYLFIIVFVFGCEADQPLIINNALYQPSTPITDIDGNTYPTVTIGNQVWMAKNLDVSHYRNGDPIIEVQDSAQWAYVNGGAWCYYENNTANGPIYGKLYNWYAVNDPRGLAPEGWHVATYQEIVILGNYLGGDSIAGKKMKSTGTQYWQSIYSNGTNESGFSALPGGFSHINGVGYSMGGMGLWWCMDNNTPDYPFIFKVSYQSLDISYNDERSGLSVRCIKD